MRTIKILFFCHILALVIGLIGILIAIPHPELLASSPFGAETLSFGVHYIGALQILLGTATMLLFGLLFVGVRKTLIFFGASATISLSMELLGTTTGFPFGPYTYTDLLGYKILGHVPYPIPLSWFFMGFTAYLLANLLVERLGWRRQTLWALVLGVYFLTVWDLSLDPSMANSHLSMQFWTWSEPGPYFGMPIRNLVGWSFNGLIYMSVSRLFWRGNLDTRRVVAWLPFGMYAANTLFAMALALNAGLWQPSLIAIVLGLLPAMLVLLPKPNTPDGQDSNSLLRFMSHLTVRKGSALIIKKNVNYTIEGLEHIPQHGPVLIVARHFHHLYDGCLLLSATPRRLHILIALDWISRSWLRAFMEQICALVEWPVVLRGEHLRAPEGSTNSVYQVGEAPRYLRQATIQTRNLLRRGEALVIFPEAYPNIDPAPGPRTTNTGFLPFRSGFTRLIEMAEKDGKTRVSVVPAGFDYAQNGRWNVTLRIGQALARANFQDAEQMVRVLEQQVHELSRPLAQEPMPTHFALQETLTYETDSI